MLRKSLIKFLFLMVSLLIVNCASQKSITSLNTSDVNPALNSRQPAPMEDNLIAGKPSDVSPVPTVDAEKEVAPIKETGSAIKHATVSQSATPAEGCFRLRWMSNLIPVKPTSKPEYHNDIKKIADAMSKYPSTSVVIVGHTDNVGKELVNVPAATEGLPHNRFVRGYGSQPERILSIFENRSYDENR
ncbi:MAG: hypothetical protein MZV70_64815 [Desulfobacterales bacterium]|nr:hypothetical protein [Desulfobacterales bacterium]